MYRIDLAAGNAACIRLSHIEFDRLDKLLKRRRLQDNIALLVGDQARSVKDDSVVAADEIYKNDRPLLKLCTMRDHIAAEADLAFVIWRGIDRNDNFGSHRQHFVGRVALVQTLFPERLVVPKIFANDDAELYAIDLKQTPVPPIARLKITRIVKNIIFRQQSLIRKP